MEYIIYPEEHKLQTAQRVTYNAEVTKYYDGQKLAKITASDLTNETLRKLLKDITGLNLIDYEFITSQMVNDEYSTDAEMVEFLASETHLDLTKLVKNERTYFLNNTLIKIDKSTALINKYLTD